MEWDWEFVFFFVWFPVSEMMHSGVRPPAAEMGDGWN